MLDIPASAPNCFFSWVEVHWFVGTVRLVNLWNNLSKKEDIGKLMPKARKTNSYNWYNLLQGSELVKEAGKIRLRQSIGLIAKEIPR